MKKFFAIMSIAALFFAACTPDNKTDEPQLPSAAGITPVVTVNGGEVTFSLPEGTTGLIPIWYTNESGDFVFAGSGNNYTKSFFTSGTFKVRMYVSNSVGQSADYAEAEFSVTAAEGFNGYDYNSEYNIWKVGEDAGMDKSYTWCSPGWGGEVNLPFTTNPYKLTVPAACNDRWQAQFHLVPGADVSLSSEKNYDFSCLIKLNKKAGVTVKLTDVTSDDNFLFLSLDDMEEGTTVYYQKNVPGIDADAIKVVFDFGYAEADTEVEITRITLKDHANDDGTNAPDKVEEADELDSACTIKAGEATNLFDLTNLAEEVGYYYAPGWAAIDNPVMSDITKTGFTLACPTATDSRWQNQVSFKLNLNLSAEKTYDFSVTINSTTAFQYGVKLTNHGDDNAIFFHDCKWHTVLEANKDCTFTIANLAGQDIPARVIFDFGGNGENTTLVVKDICLQEHIN